MPNVKKIQGQRQEKTSHGQVCLCRAGSAQQTGPQVVDLRAFSLIYCCGPDFFTADFVTADRDEDGLAMALERFVL